MSLERGAGGFRGNGRGLTKPAKRLTPHGAIPRRAKTSKISPRKRLARLPAYDEKKLLKGEREALKFDIDLEVPRGQLCAIAGPVGAGGSSLVQGMIGRTVL